MHDYVPIACVEHERLEFAVLRRQTLRLRYLDAEGKTLETLAMPLDVSTREGAEWLDFRDPTGTDQRIRLDTILQAEYQG